MGCDALHRCGRNLQKRNGNIISAVKYVHVCIYTYDIHVNLLLAHLEHKPTKQHYAAIIHKLSQSR